MIPPQWRRYNGVLHELRLGEARDLAGDLLVEVDKVVLQLFIGTW